MITLITGVPGTGKTSWLVAHLLAQQGRPIFADGVPELKLEHEPCPPIAEWTHEVPDPSSATGKKLCFTFPPNAIVCIDEAQRVYRPRPNGSKVPPEVAAFETHRHEGLDFFLITQNPTLIDANVRKLVGRHIHFRATWAGRYMHEWQEVQDVESTTARGLAATTKYKLPKQAFGHYKSAVLHTKNKAKIPFIAYVFGASLLGLAAFGWHLYGRFTEINAPKPSATASASGKTASGPIKITTAEDYIEAYKPRITGLLHTAPAYDQVTTPQDAPIPVGCLERKKTGDCKCWDQQGNTYRTTPAVCAAFIADGMFVPWRKQQEPERPAATPQAAAQGGAGSPHAMLPAINTEGSNALAGGFAPDQKKPEPTYTLRPAG